MIEQSPDTREYEIIKLEHLNKLPLHLRPLYRFFIIDRTNKLKIEVTEDEWKETKDKYEEQTTTLKEWGNRLVFFSFYDTFKKHRLYFQQILDIERAMYDYIYKRDMTKPHAILLGSTGVGKTILLKSIAEGRLECNVDELIIWLDLQNEVYPSLPNIDEDMASILKDNYKQPQRYKTLYLIPLFLDFLKDNVPAEEITDDGYTHVQYFNFLSSELDATTLSLLVAQTEKLEGIKIQSEIKKILLAFRKEFTYIKKRPPQLRDYLETLSQHSHFSTLAKKIDLKMSLENLISSDIITDNRHDPKLFNWETIFDYCKQHEIRTIVFRLGLLTDNDIQSILVRLLLLSLLESQRLTTNEKLFVLLPELHLVANRQPENVFQWYCAKGIASSLAQFRKYNIELFADSQTCRSIAKEVTTHFSKVFLMRLNTIEELILFSEYFLPRSLMGASKREVLDAINLHNLKNKGSKFYGSLYVFDDVPDEISGGYYRMWTLSTFNFSAISGAFCLLDDGMLWSLGAKTRMNPCQQYHKTPSNPKIEENLVNKYLIYHEDRTSKQLLDGYNIFITDEPVTEIIQHKPFEKFIIPLVKYLIDNKAITDIGAAVDMEILRRVYKVDQYISQLGIGKGVREQAEAMGIYLNKKARTYFIAIKNLEKLYEYAKMRDNGLSPLLDDLKARYSV